MSTCPNCQSNNTTQTPRGPHIGEYCADCSSFIRWVPQGLENFIWPIGAKHKGKPILEILRTDKRYLEWAAEAISSPGLKKKAQEALSHAGSTQTTSSTPPPKEIASNEPQCTSTQCATCTKECPLINNYRPKKALRPPSDNDNKAPWE
jgi:hypothetical protein